MNTANTLSEQLFKYDYEFFVFFFLFKLVHYRVFRLLIHLMCERIFFVPFIQHRSCCFVRKNVEIDTMFTWQFVYLNRKPNSTVFLLLLLFRSRTKTNTRLVILGLLNWWAECVRRILNFTFFFLLFYLMRLQLDSSLCVHIDFLILFFFTLFSSYGQIELRQFAFKELFVSFFRRKKIFFLWFLRGFNRIQVFEFFN